MFTKNKLYENLSGLVRRNCVTHKENDEKTFCKLTDFVPSPGASDRQRLRRLHGDRTERVDPGPRAGLA
jgi:hypothetical protein